MKMATDSLAERSLLEKAESLGLTTPTDLVKLAVVRGCRYYDVKNEADQLRRQRQFQISETDFCNEELAVTLLSPDSPPSLLSQRVASAVLSTPGISPEKLTDLAATEGCGAMLRWIAECGHAIEPGEEFWKTILRISPEFEKPERPPHPTRFIEMTGIDRGKVGIQKRWVRMVKAA